MADLRKRLKGKIDERTRESVLNRQLGEENLLRHARFNLSTGRGIANPDGSVSTIRSGSVEDPRLNKGKPTLIPFIYDGQHVDVSEAIERAVGSGKTFPAFDTNDEATAASKRISRIIRR